MRYSTAMFCSLLLIVPVTTRGQEIPQKAVYAGVAAVGGCGALVMAFTHYYVRPRIEDIDTAIKREPSQRKSVAMYKKLASDTLCQYYRFWRSIEFIGSCTGALLLSGFAAAVVGYVFNPLIDPLLGA